LAISRIGFGCGEKISVLDLINIVRVNRCLLGYLFLMGHFLARFATFFEPDIRFLKRYAFLLMDWVID
jgi:hypothetical protein